MRILHIGNGNLKHRGARYYDVGTKLNNGLIREGHNVFFLSDRDTARASNFLGSHKFGTRKCNRLFLDICYNFQPEFILLGHADIITPESLRAARQLLPGVKIAQFNVDPVFRPHNIQQILSKSAEVDATFVTTAGPVLRQFSSARSITAFMPNPVDSSIEWPRCHEQDNAPHEVFWALRAVKGSYSGDPRIDIPLFLEQQGVAIDYHGMNGKPELFRADYFSAIAKAKMGLNISVNRTNGESPEARPEELYLYASDRIAHYMGSGLLTFSKDDHNRLGELFTADKELVFFSTREELLEKITYYRNHDEERKAIAKAGWEKSHHLLNSNLVAKYILETTLRLPLTEDYAWPIARF